jgi:hypothetical protein
MSDDNKNQNLLLGCAALVGVLAVCGGMYYINEDNCNDEYESDDDEYNQYSETRNHYVNPTSECYGCGGDSSKSSTEVLPMPEKYVPPVNYSSENYTNQQPVNYSSENYTNQQPVNYSSENYELPASEHYASPLNFSAMAGGYPVENYGISDYQQLGGYSEGSQNIPVFDEKSGQIGLPVPDMTDISAGENNKYVYDRTIGTIGFTSTKINGRRRGLADFIRGDLPIIPDNNSSFNVSADPNVLQVGFMDAGEYASRYQQANPPSSKTNLYSKPGESSALIDLAKENVAARNAEEARKSGGLRAAPPASVVRQQVEKEKDNIAKEVLGPNATADQLKGVGGTREGVTIADLVADFNRKQEGYLHRNGI